MIMFWLIFTLIYIISFAIHIAIIYLTLKKYLYKIGDIIDEIEFFMWCPVLNTVTIIAVLVYYIFVGLIKLTKLDELWENFKDIKLKK